MSTRSYGEFEFWFASLKVAAIVAFIAIAGAYALGLISPAGSTVSNLWTHGFMPFGSSRSWPGVTSVIFALCGAEIATIAAAETPNPAPIVSRLTINVAVRISLFYIGSIALIVCVVPWVNIKSGFSPFTAALQQIHVPFASLIMNLVVLVAVLSCLNSGLYVTSRVLFTLSRHGDAPAGAGDAQQAPGARTGDPFRQLVRLRWGDCLDRLAPGGLCLPSELLGRNH